MREFEKTKRRVVLLSLFLYLVSAESSASIRLKVGWIDWALDGAEQSLIRIANRLEPLKQRFALVRKIGFLNVATPGHLYLSSSWNRARSLILEGDPQAMEVFAEHLGSIEGVFGILKQDSLPFIEGRARDRFWNGIPELESANDRREVVARSVEALRLHVKSVAFIVWKNSTNKDLGLEVRTQMARLFSEKLVSLSSRGGEVSNELVRLREILEDKALLELEQGMDSPLWKQLYLVSRFSDISRPAVSGDQGFVGFERGVLEVFARRRLQAGAGRADMAEVLPEIERDIFLEITRLPGWLLPSRGLQGHEILTANRILRELGDFDSDELVLWRRAAAEVDRLSDAYDQQPARMFTGRSLFELLANPWTEQAARTGRVVVSGESSDLIYDQLLELVRSGNTRLALKLFESVEERLDVPQVVLIVDAYRDSITDLSGNAKLEEVNQFVGDLTRHYLKLHSGGEPEKVLYRRSLGDSLFVIYREEGFLEVLENYARAEPGEDAVVLIDRVYKELEWLVPEQDIVAELLIEVVNAARASP